MLVSITIQVESLDPLAVLESIFEPGERHFYAERPSEGWAVAGAESVLSFEASGPGRFDDVRATSTGSSTVTAIVKGGGGIDVTTDIGTEHFDRVVSTAPMNSLLTMIADVPTSIRDAITSLRVN